MLCFGSDLMPSGDREEAGVAKAVRLRGIDRVLLGAKVRTNAFCTTVIFCHLIPTAGALPVENHVRNEQGRTRGRGDCGACTV